MQGAGKDGSRPSKGGSEGVNGTAVGKIVVSMRNHASRGSNRERVKPDTSVGGISSGQGGGRGRGRVRGAAGSGGGVATDVSGGDGGEYEEGIEYGEDLPTGGEVTAGEGGTAGSAVSVTTLTTSNLREQKEQRRMLKAKKESLYGNFNRRGGGNDRALKAAVLYLHSLQVVDFRNVTARLLPVERQGCLAKGWKQAQDKAQKAYDEGQVKRGDVGAGAGAEAGRGTKVGAGAGTGAGTGIGAGAEVAKLEAHKYGRGCCLKQCTRTDFYKK